MAVWVQRGQALPGELVDCHQDPGSAGVQEAEARTNLYRTKKELIGSGCTTVDSLKCSALMQITNRPRRNAQIEPRKRRFRSRSQAQRDLCDLTTARQRRMRSCPMILMSSSSRAGRSPPPLPMGLRGSIDAGVCSPYSAAHTRSPFPRAHRRRSRDASSDADSYGRRAETEAMRHAVCTGPSARPSLRRQ